MDAFPTDIRVMRVYWVLGDTRAARKDAVPNEVRNPQSTGWQTAVVVGEPDANQFILLDPYHLHAYTVSKRSAEILYAKDETEVWSTKAVTDRVLDTWDKTIRYGLGAGYDAAAVVLRKLGADVPLHTTSVTTATKEREEVSEETTEGKSGRRVQRLAAKALIKPVVRKSNKGRVLQWLLDNPGSSVKAMQVDLDLKKTIVGANLFLLHRDHGIGQHFDGDAVTVLLPEGCDNPFKD